MPTLYYAPGSCSLAVHLVLEELGHPYQLQKVDLKAGQQHSSEFRSINAKGRVPVLQDGDLWLTEVTAIMVYLARRYPESDLLSHDPAELGRTLEWCNWLATACHATAAALIWRPHRFVDDEALFMALGAKGRTSMLENFSLIEQSITRYKWAAGSHYSIADPYLLVFYRWGYRMGLDMRTQFTHWTAHAEAVCARSATGRVLAQEEIAVWP